LKTEKQKIGDKGEELAVKFLKNNGFSILDTNYLKPWGEIDIVGLKNNVIHFIEVKTVSIKNGNKDDYDPLFNIGKNKKIRLRRVIQTYLKDKQKEDFDYQVDAISVYLVRDRNDDIEHLEDILL